MCKEVNYNVIEKNKYESEMDIKKYIKIIVDKLIANEFAKVID